MTKTEQPAIYVFRQGSHLVPEMDLDAELIGRFSQCDRIKVTLATGRSPPKKSISFSSMSEQEFDDFLASATRWVEETYGITASDVFPKEKAA